MKIEIVPATAEHARLLAPNLRQSDKEEVMASCGNEPLEALLRSVELSQVCWTALLDDRPEIMWGAAPYPLDDSWGIVWLLSSDRMYEVPGRFLEESDNYVNKMLETFSTLFNYVDARNTKSRMWLKRLGFEEMPRVESYGHAGLPFIPFVRSNNV